MGLISEADYGDGVEILLILLSLLVCCRPNVMQAAQEMQRNNPELFASMQQQAAQFAGGGAAQPQPQPQQGQQQGPSDSSSSDSKGSEQNKKQ